MTVPLPTSTPALCDPWPGVACPLRWDRDAELTYWSMGATDWHRHNPLLPRPAVDELVCSSLQSLPLWPATEPGQRMRRAYELDGERALTGRRAGPYDDTWPWWR